MCWQFPDIYLGINRSNAFPLFDFKFTLFFTSGLMFLFTFLYIMAVLGMGLIGRLHRFVQNLPSHIQLGAIAVQFGDTEDVRAELEKAHDLLQAYKCTICHVQVADCIVVTCRHFATCMELYHNLTKVTTPTRRM